MKKWVPASMAAVLVSGCGLYSEAPLVEYFPYSTQQKVQAGHHWDIIAGDVAKRIQETDIGGRSMVVDSPDHPTAFNEAFHKLMVSHLVQQGNAVHKEPEYKDLHVVNKVQVVRHKDRDKIRYPLGTFLALTATGASIYAARNWSDWELLAFPAVFGLEYGQANPDRNAPPTEILVTSSVLDGNRFVASFSDLYYINTGDTENYAGTPPAPPKRPPFRVVDR